MRLGRKKATGRDKIPTEAWEYGESIIMMEMKEILERIYVNEVIPDDWKTGVIVLIYKKGERNKVENYRRFALIDTGYKIYTDILRERLVID